MYRLLLCLSVCLSLSPSYPENSLPDEPAARKATSQEPLPHGDIVTFLEKALERYDQQGIKGYSCIFQKQERIGGKLQLSEEIEVFFRDQPHSVFMHWLRGQRKADSMIYVEGENNGQMLVHPAGIAGTFVKVVTRDPEGEEAKQSGRYSVIGFGMKKALERAVEAWKTAKEKDTLQVEYLGIRTVHEAGDRPCYTLHRTLPKPQEDGTLDVTLYIDKDSWLQVGSVIKGEDNKLIGEYMFRDIHINPQFKANQFERSALTH